MLLAQCLEILRYILRYIGILAGCNHSGELRDPQKSIPRGAIGAIFTATIVYVAFVFLLSATFDNLVLRDK